MNKTEILNNYFENPELEENKRKLKNMLITQIVLADTASEVNGAKFLLENIFDWKNDGAITTTKKTDIINVEFVSNMKGNKNDDSQ